MAAGRNRAAALTHNHSPSTGASAPVSFQVDRYPPSFITERPHLIVESVDNGSRVPVGRRALTSRFRTLPRRNGTSASACDTGSSAESPPRQWQVTLLLPARSPLARSRSPACKARSPLSRRLPLPCVKTRLASAWYKSCEGCILVRACHKRVPKSAVRGSPTRCLLCANRCPFPIATMFYSRWSLSAWRCSSSSARSRHPPAIRCLSVAAGTSPRALPEAW